MNLETDVHEIRRRIAEEFADDEANESITDSDIVGWLNEAELRFAEDAPAEVAVTETAGATIAGVGLLGTQIENVAAATASFTLPDDFLKPITVGYAARGGAGFLPPARLLKWTDFLLARKREPAFYPSENDPVASIHNKKIWLLPLGAASITAGFEMFYVRIPQRRYKRYSGQVTGVTSTTVFADSKMTAKAWPDDYFNSGYCRFISGASRGLEVSVSDYTKATGTITLATAVPQITNGDEFEIGENSAVPNKYRPYVMEYATHLALCKDRDDLAQKHLAEYSRMINALQGRALGLEVPQG